MVWEKKEEGRESTRTGYGGVTSTTDKDLRPQVSCVLDRNGRLAKMLWLNTYRVTRATPTAAEIVFLAQMVAGAQQQRSNSPAAWPCGARIDSSYFHVAEGTGGHLLLLAPEEIGDSATLLTALGAHPQTIFRLAGSVTTGLHEFEVPIDPSIESVLFSISVQCLQTAEVVRPSGALAVGDDATLLPSFRAQHVVIVKRPQAGTWTLRVAGSGIAAVVVQAQSAIGISQPQFASAPGAPSSAVPVAGVENIATLRISGRVSDV